MLVLVALAVLAMASKHYHPESDGGSAYTDGELVRKDDRTAQLIQFMNW